MATYVNEMYRSMLNFLSSQCFEKNSYVSDFISITIGACMNSWYKQKKI